MTASLDALTHAVHVSTWPTGTPESGVPARASRTCLMYPTRTSGPTPGFSLLRMPVGEMRYRSSEPTEIPAMRPPSWEP